MHTDTQKKENKKGALAGSGRRGGGGGGRLKLEAKTTMSNQLLQGTNTSVGNKSG